MKITVVGGSRGTGALADHGLQEMLLAAVDDASTVGRAFTIVPA
jgi:hypothetical protein